MLEATSVADGSVPGNGTYQPILPRAMRVSAKSS
jgi:hypothetical protein